MKVRAMSRTSDVVGGEEHRRALTDFQCRRGGPRHDRAVRAHHKQVRRLRCGGRES